MKKILVVFMVLSSLADESFGQACGTEDFLYEVCHTDFYLDYSNEAAVNFDSHYKDYITLERVVVGEHGLMFRVHDDFYDKVANECRIVTAEVFVGKAGKKEHQLLDDANTTHLLNRPGRIKLEVNCVPYGEKTSAKIIELYGGLSKHVFQDITEPIDTKDLVDDLYVTIKNELDKKAEFASGYVEAESGAMWAAKELADEKQQSEQHLPIAKKANPKKQPVAKQETRRKSLKEEEKNEKLNTNPKIALADKINKDNANKTVLEEPDLKGANPSDGYGYMSFAEYSAKTKAVAPTDTIMGALKSNKADDGIVKPKLSSSPNTIKVNNKKRKIKNKVRKFFEKIETNFFNKLDENNNSSDELDPVKEETEDK